MAFREQVILVKDPSNKTVFDVLICGVSLAVFAYFINNAFPLKTIAFTALLTAAFIISQNIKWLPSSLWEEIFSFEMLAFYLIGFLMGTAGAMYYRGSLGMPVLPATVKIFSLLAVGIAIIEELVFRGFIQGGLSKLHPGFAIVFAAFAHASYKVGLFLSPAAPFHYAMLPFYTWSFSAFILIGLLRYYSKSIVPAIIAHVVFDLIVYAENTQAPWWVW